MFSQISYQFDNQMIRKICWICFMSIVYRSYDIRLDFNWCCIETYATLLIHRQALGEQHGRLSEHAFTPYQETRPQPTMSAYFVCSILDRIYRFVLLVLHCIVYLFVQFWYFVLYTLWSIVFINMPSDAPSRQWLYHSVLDSNSREKNNSIDAIWARFLTVNKQMRLDGRGGLKMEWIQYRWVSFVGLKSF